MNDAPQRTWVDGRIGIHAEQLESGLVDQYPEMGRDAVRRQVVDEWRVKGRN